MLSYEYQGWKPRRKERLAAGWEAQNCQPPAVESLCQTHHLLGNVGIVGMVRTRWKGRGGDQEKGSDSEDKAGGWWVVGIVGNGNAWKPPLHCCITNLSRAAERWRTGKESLSVQRIQPPIPSMHTLTLTLSLSHPPPLSLSKASSAKPATGKKHNIYSISCKTVVC